MTTDHFGPDVATRYDEDEASMFMPAALGPALEYLSARVGDGPVLELGIGTGRVALPLRERGIDVHGIDLSTAMVEQLRAKPGGADVPVVIGDFATTSAPAVGSYSLAYLVFNTIGNLTTQRQQVDCFRNAARHLSPGGIFVIEVGTPGVISLPPGESAKVFDLSDEHIGFDEYDAVAQSLRSHHFYRDGANWRYGMTPLRYVWPSELDLMAELAGMSLIERWAGWDRSEFTAASQKHISAWQLPT